MNPIEQFRHEHCIYHGVSEDRQRDQVRVLAMLADHVDKSLLDVEAGDIRDFLAAELANGRQPSTVQKHLMMVKTFYRWAYERHLIGRFDWLDVREVRPPRSVGRGQPRPYSRQELRQWWAALDERFPLSDYYVKRFIAGRSRYHRIHKHANRLQLQAMVTLALYCGLRRHEIFRADYNDIHPDNDYVVVRFGARKGGSSEERMREVPLTIGASELMLPWFEFRDDVLKPDHDRPWLSLYRDHRLEPMSENRVERLLRPVPGPWELHRFRHTCATEWLRAKMPLAEVQALMGHATIEQTLQYAKLVQQDVKETAVRLEGRFDRAVGPRETGGDVAKPAA